MGTPRDVGLIHRSTRRPRKLHTLPEVWLALSHYFLWILVFLVWAGFSACPESRLPPISGLVWILGWAGFSACPESRLPPISGLVWNLGLSRLRLGPHFQQVSIVVRLVARLPVPEFKFKVHLGARTTRMTLHGQNTALYSPSSGHGYRPSAVYSASSARISGPLTSRCCCITPSH